MNAAFFGLALLSALNPKLLVIDLILTTNRRPRLMFVCFLLGGMGLAITAGLLDVFVVHLDEIKIQNHASGALDLALGIPLLVVGLLLATNHLRLGLRRHAAPKKKRVSKLESWVLRALHEPRYGLAIVIGLVAGVPGASYLLALKHLVDSKTSAAAAAFAVVLFVIINFTPVIVPFAFAGVHPQRTESALKRFKNWIVSHERQIAAAVALVAGAYMVISGALRQLGLPRRADHSELGRIAQDLDVVGNGKDSSAAGHAVFGRNTLGAGADRARETDIALADGHLDVTRSGKAVR
jgi:drug/metabolite transporter (DMT)-like permease